MDPLFCPKNDDIPWIGEDGITVFEPWMSYPVPEHGCCDVPSQDADFDAQGRPYTRVRIFTNIIRTMGKFKAVQLSSLFLFHFRGFVFLCALRNE